MSDDLVPWYTPYLLAALVAFDWLCDAWWWVRERFIDAWTGRKWSI